MKASLSSPVLVHRIWVSVMHPGAKNRVGALQYRAKCQLGAGRRVPNGANVAGDVLWEAHDIGPQGARAIRAAKLP